MSTALSKKQQKALLFRQKQKSKKTGEAIPGDLPEQDLPEEYNEQDDIPSEVQAESSTTPTAAIKDKKRKRHSENHDEKEDLTDGIKGKVKNVGKGKGKVWEDDVDDQEGKGTGKKSKKEVKQRFILFIGNLGFKTTVPEIQAHFREAVGHPPQVRLLTTKPSTPSQPPKSRGIAFLELPSSTSLQAALKLHHTQLSGRRINVELTAGGGGKSEGRVKKVAERNERVGVQRTKREEREREAAIAEGREVQGPEVVAGKVEVVRDQPGEGSRATQCGKPRDPALGQSTEYQDGVKIRNGRRVKMNNNPHGASSGPNPPNRGGWQDRPLARGQPAQRGGRRWEPTGANAVTVG